MYGQRAFSLTEALVGIAIISLGALGVARLQITALRGNESAYYSTQATLILSDMIERIRANPPRPATATQTNLPFLYLPTDASGGGTAFDFAAIDCSTTNPLYRLCADRYSPASSALQAANTGSCATAGDLALYDMFVAKCGLPNGTASDALSGGYEKMLPPLTGGALANIALRCMDWAAGSNQCLEIQMTLTWGERMIRPRNAPGNASESTALENRSIIERFRP